MEKYNNKWMVMGECDVVTTRHDYLTTIHRMMLPPVTLLI